MKTMKNLNRIYHPWWKWECYKAGFFNTSPPPGISKEEAIETYRVFLSNLRHFNDAIWKVFAWWPNSCEHFLTNPTMNRIAWIGQASLCIETGIPSIFRVGYKLLSKNKQIEADQLAQSRLEEWIKLRCLEQKKR